MYIVSGCSMLAQKDYKRRHDKVCLNIHWALCKKYGVKVCETWYEHKVVSDIENDIVKIIRDVCIQLDRQVAHDVACLVDNNLILKRSKKIDKYSELC